MLPADRTKSVLVVDDEPEIRKLVGAMVTQFGYSVLTADSGEHALALYKTQGPFELLITDVVAPGMSGPMLAEKITALQPDLKVLYISGFDNTQVVQKYVVNRGHALLIKPFAVSDLRNKIEELLEVSAPQT
jgi:two-component system, cell cycle sensor histidine kinase and response regulator CckA